MNTDNIRRLADIIEQQPHTTVSALSGFTMLNWTHDCGTPACIAGWANYLHNSDGREQVRMESAYRARLWLGLGEEDADELFGIGEDDPGLESVTPTHAAAVLRHLADTGEVDWSVGT